MRDCRDKFRPAGWSRSRMYWHMVSTSFNSVIVRAAAWALIGSSIGSLTYNSRSVHDSRHGDWQVAPGVAALGVLRGGAEVHQGPQGLRGVEVTVQRMQGT